MQSDGMIEFVQKNKMCSAMQKWRNRVPRAACTARQRTRDSLDFALTTMNRPGTIPDGRSGLFAEGRQRCVAMAQIVVHSLDVPRGRRSVSPLSSARYSRMQIIPPEP